VHRIVLSSNLLAKRSALKFSDLRALIFSGDFEELFKSDFQFIDNLRNNNGRNRESCGSFERFISKREVIEAGFVAGGKSAFPLAPPPGSFPFENGSFDAVSRRGFGYPQFIC
jgi:hypothetical protein